MHPDQEQIPLPRSRRLKAGSPLVRYRVPRYRIKLVRESAVYAAEIAPPLQTSTAAAALLRPCFVGLDREQFVVCGLDAKYSVIGINVVSIGSLRH